MKVANIYIEYSSMAIDQSFTYLCDELDVQRGKRVEVEFAHKIVVGFVSNVEEQREEELLNYPYKLKSIIRVIDDKPFLNDELFKIATYMSKAFVAPLISCFQAMLPAKLKPKSNNQKILKEAWVVYKEEKEVSTNKQKEALAFIKSKKRVKRSEFNLLYRTQLAALIKKNIVYLEEKEKESNFSYHNEDSTFSLTNEQKQAVEKMNKNRGYCVFLLHGVTGSGKSEVFMRMAKQVIEEGKQVLFLVPEISLTPQMVKRVTARFGDAVAIYHSSLNNQEKYEQYKLVYEKKVSIVVGTRSAVFMPFENLGLIIVDEEHDQSYKQDSTPKYHTRDIALKRGEYHDCKVILASATPSLESYARAIKDVYTLVEMPTRVYGDMPNTKLIDMKENMRNGESYILSNILKEAIKQRLDAKEQVILLLNRRGYAPILRCMDCGNVLKCPHCDLALNYHKNTNELKCHICGYSEVKQYRCKKCGSSNIKYIGMGTQKLEEYIQECFPTARIVRMDADTTTTKNAHEKLLNEFENNGDILLGTQMIAKGLDYENVTLVGILNGDALLNRSDYRSVELTYDLLVQASGRSGRGVKDGEVMIQVYDVNHYAITCAQRHDYKTFFMHEMQFRHLGKYPPYTYLGVITLLSENEEKVNEEGSLLKEQFIQEDIKVLGPIELIKIKDKYRVRMILKGKEQEAIAIALYDAYKHHIKAKGKAKVEIDMNPYMLD